MPVITVCNTKGGVGKTTLVICLADALGRKGYRVAILDADPNAHVASWANIIDGQTPVTVVPAVNENNLFHEIDRTRELYDFVFIDLEGAATQLVTYAIGESDLVLMPTRTSGMDLQELFRTAEQVKRAERTARRHIDARAVFSQIPPLQNTVTKHARNEVSNYGIKVFQTEIVARPKGYGGIHYNGITPCHPAGDEKAGLEIGYLMDEILRIFIVVSEAA